jgi:hypothetical protein
MTGIAKQSAELEQRCLGNGGELPLPLWERVGVRGSGPSTDRNPSPGSHLRCDPTSPTRGEVGTARFTFQTARTQEGLRPSLRAKRSNPCRGAKKEWIASSLSLLAMTSRHDFAISRPDRPELCQKFPLPSSQRAQGTPGARCTRGLVCKRAQKNAHEHTGQRRQSGIPCAMGYGCFVLSPVTGLVCHRRRRIWRVRAR